MSSIGYSAFLYCGKLNIDVSDDNSYYCDIDGILFSKDKKSIIKYTKYILQPEYSIPSGVTNIGDAFSMCPELKSVIIPQGVLEIADDAFIFSSNLTSITIPDSIKSIDNWGFNWNVSPKDVYYIGTKAQWDKIEFVHGNDWLKNSTIHCINGDISLGTEDNTNNSGTSNGGQTTTGENGTTTITNNNAIVTSIELYIGQTTANVNGQAVQNDVAPVVRNDRTMLPARFVAENLGAAVAWDQAAQQVVITPIN